MPTPDFKLAVYRLANLLQATIGFIDSGQYGPAQDALELQIEEAKVLADGLRQHQRAMAAANSDGGGFP